MDRHVARLIARYRAEDPDFLLPASPASPAALLDTLKRRAEQLPPFESFPEGDAGVVVYLLLAHLQRYCPDAGDFGHALQGFEKIAEMAADLLAEEIAESLRPGPG